MKEDMQFVVQFEGGPLHGHQVIWRTDKFSWLGTWYETVYVGQCKIPERYILMEKGTEPEKPTEIKFPRYTLDIPSSILELEYLRRYKILGQLQSFVNSAVAKYVAGQKEHGGKLEDRECFTEMHNELLDLMWYWYAEKERRDSKCNP